MNTDHGEHRFIVDLDFLTPTSENADDDPLKAMVPFDNPGLGDQNKDGGSKLCQNIDMQLAHVY